MEKPKQVRKEFAFHKLNDDGIEKARLFGVYYSELVDTLIKQIGNHSSPELAIAIRKLEESCFYAKKAMANNPAHQV